MIYAPCGCGKTTAAINKIAPLASSPRKAIYLIDTRIGMERLSQNSQLTTPSFAYDEAIIENFGFFENDGKIAVTTYAKFGYWCALHPNFALRYEYIICDEPHNLVLFSQIGTDRPSEIDAHKEARRAICDAVNSGKVTVVGISATPKPLEKLDCPLKSIPIDRENLHHYTERETVQYGNIDVLLNEIPLGKRGGLYVKHVRPMKKYAEILRARGLNPLMIWSDKSEKHILSAEQLAARQYIIDNERVPDEYDVFLFNATAETSINIYSHMDFFIAHSPEKLHIEQSRGRYRGDLETLYIYNPTGRDNLVVPEEHLEKPQFKSDLVKLRDYLGLKKDGKGHALSTDEMLIRLDDCGYSHEAGPKMNRRETIIIHGKE